EATRKRPLVVYDGLALPLSLDIPAHHLDLPRLVQYHFAFEHAGSIHRLLNELPVLVVADGRAVELVVAVGCPERDATALAIDDGLPLEHAVPPCRDGACPARLVVARDDRLDDRIVAVDPLARPGGGGVLHQLILTSVPWTLRIAALF